METSKRWSVINKKNGNTLANKNTRAQARAVKSRYTNAYIYDNLLNKAVR